MLAVEHYWASVDGYTVCDELHTSFESPRAMWKVHWVMALNGVSALSIMLHLDLLVDRRHCN